MLKNYTNNMLLKVNGLVISSRKKLKDTLRQIKLRTEQHQLKNIQTQRG